MLVILLREGCRPVTNDSPLPNNWIFGSVTRFSDFNIDNDTIIKIIGFLDPSNIDTKLLLKLFVHWNKTELTAVMECQYAY